MAYSLSTSYYRAHYADHFKAFNADRLDVAAITKLRDIHDILMSWLDGRLPWSLHHEIRTLDSITKDLGAATLVVRQPNLSIS
jgi:hypothetical protein